MAIANAYFILPAASEIWPHERICTLVRLGGCREDIKAGERLAASRVYGFLKLSDLQACKRARDTALSGKMKFIVPIEQAQGVISVDDNIVMTVKTRLQVCCPGGNVEGVVEHPEYGEIYIIKLGRF